MGSGEVLFKRNKIYYEQENLQLNMKKLMVFQFQIQLPLMVLKLEKFKK